MSQSSFLPSRRISSLPDVPPPPETDGRMPSPDAVGKELFSVLPGSLPPGPLAGMLGRALGLNRLCALYARMERTETPEAFAREALTMLDVRIRAEGPDGTAGADAVPAEGPLLFVSNHPFGMLEGLVLMAIFLPRRPDLLILANSMLGMVGPLAGRFIGVDPFGGDAAPRRNQTGLRRALRHLENGGALTVFPAGEVSHWRPGLGITDPQWNDAAVRLARRSGAAIIPLCFRGRNSLSFSLAGLVHPLCRTMLLPRELLARRGSAVELRVGRPVQVLSALPDPRTATDYLRMRCYELNRPHGNGPARTMQPIAAPTPKELLEEEIAGLPASALLVREGEYSLYLRRGAESPMLFRELGRVREETFRNVGEGSGKPLDLDTYDRHYRHLLLWNERNRELAGAYRIGLTPEILRSRGVRGLYGNTLFRFSPAFFRQYGQSLELGRALVHPRYQRDFLPLLLLWKGISRFVLRHPSIRTLFGPVSLNLDASETGLALIASYLLSRHGLPEAPVRGRRPPHGLRLDAGNGGETLNRAINRGELDYRKLDALVRDLDDGRGIPILFKHYLKLGGRIAAFHQDDSFNTLDGLLIVDLPLAPLPLLGRYMGAEAAERYVRLHGVSPATTPSGSGRKG